MSLIEAIEEVDNQIAERDGKVEDKEPVKAEPEAKEEPKAEPPSAPHEAESVEPKKPTDSDFARLRVEKAAAEKREKEALQRLADLSNKTPAPQAQAPAPVTASDPEPDKATQYEAWLEWHSNQLRTQVGALGKTVEEVAEWKQKTLAEKQEAERKDRDIKSLQRIEAEFAKDKPDYADVREHLYASIAQSARISNPFVPQDQLSDIVSQQLLWLARRADAQGYNPIEYLYHKSKEWGYQPKAPEPAKVEEPAKATLKTIADNKKKSVSSLTAGGKGSPAPLSRDALKSMKFSDVTKLSPERFREWENASKELENAG